MERINRICEATRIPNATKYVDVIINKNVRMMS